MRFPTASKPATFGVGGGGAIATCGSDTNAYFTDTGTITL